MTFTETDAQNDGLIKREVGKEMAKVAKTQNPELFEHFDNVCNELGREPWEVFGEMCVRSLNNEQYAQRLMSSEVNMGDLRADEIRLEDVRYVKELTEELGLKQEEQDSDPIDQLINKRLKSVTSSPLDNIGRNNGDVEGVNGEVVQHMESLQHEIERLEAKIDGDDVSSESPQKGGGQSDKSVDELFGEGDSNGQTESGGADSTSDTVEMGDEEVGQEEDGEGEVQQDGASPEVADESGTGEKETEGQGSELEGGSDGTLTDENIDEAFEGLEGGVDDASDSVESETLEEKERENGIDDMFVTSEDGEEE